jgi:hypothetical protein
MYVFCACARRNATAKSTENARNVWDLGAQSHDRQCIFIPKAGRSRRLALAVTLMGSPPPYPYTSG